jgi:hypothetical protein
MVIPSQNGNVEKLLNGKRQIKNVDIPLEEKWDRENEWWRHFRIATRLVDNHKVLKTGNG